MNQFLAQIDPRVVLHEEFNKPTSWAEILVIGLSLVALVGVLALVNRMQQRRSGQLRSQFALFRELVGTVGLSAAQQRLLRKMAADLDLAMPARMLLSADLFADTVRKWVDKRGSGLREPHKLLIADIRNHLFGADSQSGQWVGPTV